MSDFIKSFRSTNQWLLLAWYDVRQRYRRSVLGPFWITLSTAIMILTLGYLWTHIFKVDIPTFLPFFAAGTIMWGFISAQINDACTGFSQFEGYIRQINLPLPVYILRLWARNLIFLAHNFVIMIGVYIYLDYQVKPLFGQFVLGFLLLSYTLLMLSVPIAYLCARFRDIPPIIQNIMQIVYFLTPIFWQPHLLPVDKSYVTGNNPFFHALEVVRGPLTGHAPQMISWYWMIASALICTLLALWSQAKFKRRVAYWL